MTNAMLFLEELTKIFGTGLLIGMTLFVIIAAIQAYREVKGKDKDWWL